MANDRGRMYVAMTIQQPSAIKVIHQLVTASGLKPHEVPVTIDGVPGLVGFLPVFSNAEAAAEWGNGQYIVVEAAPKTFTEEEVQTNGLRDKTHRTDRG